MKEAERWRKSMGYDDFKIKFAVGQTIWNGVVDESIRPD
jgi:hypothetical protein